MSSKRFFPLALQAMLFLTVFVTSVSFRTRDYGSTGMDWQVLLRLGMMAASLGLCTLAYKAWLGKILRPDNLPMTILIALFAVSALYAPSLSYSLGCSFSIISFYLLTITSLQILGPRRTVGTLIALITLISAMSFIAYFVTPELSRVKIWQGNHQVLTHRLKGLTGANGAGGMAAIALLFAFFYRFYFHRRSRWLALAFVINAAVLIMSNSRTALASLILSVLFGLFSRATPARLTMIFAGIAFFAFALVTVDYNALFSLVSRSGNAEEILTGTGRLYIWQKSLDLIAEHPFRGWGYGSSSFILPQYSQTLGDAAPHCHNIFLQLAFSVGWIGAILYAIILITKFMQALRMQDTFRLALLCLTFIGGLTEAAAFIGVANIGTMILAMIVAMEYKPASLPKLEENLPQPPLKIVRNDEQLPNPMSI